MQFPSDEPARSVKVRVFIRVRLAGWAPSSHAAHALLSSNGRRPAVLMDGPKRRQPGRDGVDRTSGQSCEQERQSLTRSKFSRLPLPIIPPCFEGGCVEIGRSAQVIESDHVLGHLARLDDRQRREHPDLEPICRDDGGVADAV